MRRAYYVMYPAALVVLVWAECGIIRVNLPASGDTPVAPGSHLIAASATPISMSGFIADARAGRANR